ncbi:MAG: hypothetical protein F4Z14_11590 [Gammaproteobacteria bacterium]|nr:hypothetical protein [Gammaproteobacteria bacterium]
MGNNWNPASESSFEQIARHVNRVINIKEAELGEEFFPAHLSIALINSILTPGCATTNTLYPLWRGIVRVSICRELEQIERRFLLCPNRRHCLI